jgi:hypothetical protein
VVDLLFHVLADAQRALVTFASPAEGPADVDYVTYWSAFKPGGDDSSRHAWWVRRSASAFTEPSGVVRLWTDTAPAAVRAAEVADPASFVGTQGHVLAVPDFISTLVVEAAVHYLDLVADLPDAPPPAPEALDVAAATLDGLLGAPRPSGWDLPTYVLKGPGG